VGPGRECSSLRRAAASPSAPLPSAQCKNSHLTEMCCGTEAGSYLRIIDSCITQLKAPGHARTCNESKEEEEEEEACDDQKRDQVLRCRAAREQLKCV